MSVGPSSMGATDPALGQRPYCVGLTGGVGSGKSTVAGLFAALGVSVIDTDQIAHEITQAGGGAMPALRAAFGPDMIAPDGSLDRARMRKLVFADSESRRHLESILHPLILAEVRRRLEAPARGGYVLLIVPLLVEAGGYRRLVDRVLVVDCDEAQQLQRTARRPGLSEADALAIIGAQAPRAERLACADDVLDNRGDVRSLRHQVEALHQRYLVLARAHGAPGVA